MRAHTSLEACLHGRAQWRWVKADKCAQLSSSGLLRCGGWCLLVLYLPWLPWLLCFSWSMLCCCGCCGTALLAACTAVSNGMCDPAAVPGFAAPEGGVPCATEGRQSSLLSCLLCAARSSVCSCTACLSCCCSLCQCCGCVFCWDARATCVCVCRVQQCVVFCVPLTASLRLVCSCGLSKHT